MAASNEYYFVTRWCVPGRAEEVSNLLQDAAGLPRWWPSVYLDVQVLDPGDANGVGKHVRVLSKGWLPYKLRWEFRVTESQHPHGFAITAAGDFVGTGRWTLAQEGTYVVAVYDWKLLAEKPLLRWLSFVFKPLFEANHHWAMARGEESLRLELSRREARQRVASEPIPPPPGPTFVRKRSAR